MNLSLRLGQLTLVGVLVATYALTRPPASVATASVTALPCHP